MSCPKRKKYYHCKFEGLPSCGTKNCLGVTTTGSGKKNRKNNEKERLY